MPRGLLFAAHPRAERRYHRRHQPRFGWSRLAEAARPRNSTTRC